MRIRVDKDSVSIWLSATDTENWAQGFLDGGKRWPASGLAGNRVYAYYTARGLEEITFNGRSHDLFDGHEVNNCIADHAVLSKKLKRGHPCYDTVIADHLPHH